MKIDLKVVEPDQFGNVLQHFTGSKAHNVALRESAVRRGLHISEYGILDDETGETLRCATRGGGLRAARAAVDPARAARGPRRAGGRAPSGAACRELVTLEDLKGDLHMHTTASDGRQTAEEMAIAARERGLRVHRDHRPLGLARVRQRRLARRSSSARIEEIHALNERLEGIEVLIGTESNILTDGSLDYPDELLERLDWVIASVHTSFRMRAKEMTDRMVAAIEHPLVDAIGHPTGRKIETRQPYALDVDRVIEAAARTGTMLEINSAPDRRDLDEIHAREAARAGVPILIDSDAHSTVNLAPARATASTPRAAPGSRRSRSPTPARGPSSGSCANGNVQPAN